MPPPDAFPGGATRVAGGCHAWLQPDGGWGLSNAGLILGAGESMLVDTLFDLHRTRHMLAGFAPLTDRCPIRTVVNTHGNGDHWFGNELVVGADIVAAASTVADMRAVGPQQLVDLLAMPGPTGDYVSSIFGDFDFTGITPTLPTRVFDGELVLDVGGTEVVLSDVGPAHTSGDTIVYCPRDRVVYTGDIVFAGDTVFAGGTPIVWAGPFANWTAACRMILGLDAEFLVPGHGPVCSPSMVRTVIDYLEFVYAEAAARHGRGMTAAEAAHDIDLGVFSARPESERLSLNVVSAYREFDAAAGAPVSTIAGPALFGCMAELHGSV